MSIRSDPLDELAIPDGTTVEEHDLVTDGDVVVGGQSTVEFGVRGGDVMAGERVTFGGGIEAEGDCRLDMWSEVAEDVLVGGDAYLGERVSVGGQLKLSAMSTSSPMSTSPATLSWPPTLTRSPR